MTDSVPVLNLNYMAKIQNNFEKRKRITKLPLKILAGVLNIWSIKAYCVHLYYNNNVNKCKSCN